MFYKSLEGYPIVVQEEHELYDEEFVGESGMASFFRDSRSFASVPNVEKIPFVNTNVLGPWGSLPPYHSKEVESVVVTVVDGQVPPNCTPRLELHFACSPVYSTTFEFGVPIPMNTSEIVIGDFKDLGEEDKVAIRQAISGPLTLMQFENYEIRVMDVPQSVKLRVSIRGRFIHPDLTSREFSRWRSALAALAIKSTFQRGTAIGDPVLFDEEIVAPGESRRMFSRSRSFGLTGGAKDLRHSNLIASGGHLPRGHFKVVKAVAVEVFSADEERRRIDASVDVAFRWFGHEIAHWEYEAGVRLSLAMPKTGAFLVSELEPFEVIVTPREKGTHAPLGERVVVRVGLEGPYFTPRAG